MSEPATTGKVIINTTKGDLEVELWCKEVPESTRRFLENCIAGKYNGKRFMRIVPNQLVQVEEIEDSDEPMISDEYNSRIKFQRAYLALNNEDLDRRNHHSCKSFFITLDTMPEFNKKYNIIGKVVGTSFYNLVKISESEMENDVPIYPAKITDVKIAVKYFEDLRPPAEEQPQQLAKKRKVTKLKVKMTYDEEESEEDDDFRMKNLHSFIDAKSKSQSDTTIEKQAKDLAPVEVDLVQKSKSTTPEPHQEPIHQEPIHQEPIHQEPIHQEPIHQDKLERNPAIDSDYDSDLDYRPDISIDIVKSHKFIVKG